MAGRVLTFFRIADKGVAKVEDLAYLVSNVMPVVLYIFIFVGVIARVLRYSVLGYVEVSEMVIAAILYLSIAKIQRHRRHIGVDFFTDKYKGKVRLYKILQAFFAVLSIVPCAIIAMVGFNYALKLKGMGTETPLLEIPTWPFHMLIFVGMALLCLRFVYDLFYLRWPMVHSGETPLYDEASEF